MRKSDGTLCTLHIKSLASKEVRELTERISASRQAS
jgi:hypothetical protein